MIGFVKRISIEFKQIFPLKVLYCSQIRPIFEYGSVVWEPLSVNNFLMLERVQNKFLKYTRHFLNIDCSLYNYSSVLHHFNLL